MATADDAMVERAHDPATANDLPADLGGLSWARPN